MTRQIAAGDVNSFVKGLITEASPLTFPANASLDEINISLNKDGSRRRRLGMDYETGYYKFDSNQTSDAELTFSSFVWKQPGGYTNKEFLVVQTGNRVTIMDSSTNPITNNIMGQYDIGTSSSQKMSMTSVDGIMIITAGDGNIYSFDHDGTGFVISSGRLKIRDLFGVADVTSGIDLLSGSYIGYRPQTLTQAHTYNLRNQTFAIPRKYMNIETLWDPISAFSSRHAVDIGITAYPSNADSVVTFLYADSTDTDDRNSRRYFPIDAIANPLGTNRAPMGYFIIDALNRGSSRIEEDAKLRGQYGQLGYPVNALPSDYTPGGASVVASFSGRVWYSGFSAKVVDGDSRSPRMTSYVLFSKLVQSPPDIFKCYQEGDPTSSETPDLIDTDGGFLRIDGAYNIQQLVPVGDSLMVVAENGVWKIAGGSGYGFKATDYLITKVTEHGCLSPGSVVVVDNTFMYWADDGIYHIRQNQYGDWIGTNISTDTIQTLFDNIPFLSKQRCQGSYDSYTRQVRWLHNNYVGATGYCREIVLDVALSAFYQSELKPLTASGQYPLPMSIAKIPPFSTAIAISTVEDANGNTVLDLSLNTVGISEESVISQTAELCYLVATGISGGTLQFTIATYKDDGFVDWASEDNVGIDAAGYILTGWTSGADYQRMKQVPYLTVYSIKTETGFTTSFEPENSSSILVQGQWNWTNLATSGKWTIQFQAYRHKRFWIPQSSSSGFDDGEHVVVTRNRLRGRGMVLSLRFDTEPGKDFHLLGWSYVMALNGNI